MNRYRYQAIVLSLALTGTGCSTASSEGDAPVVEESTVAPQSVCNSATGYCIRADGVSYWYNEAEGFYRYYAMGYGEALYGGSINRGLCLVYQWEWSAPTCSGSGWNGSYYCIGGTQWYKGSNSTYCAGSPATGSAVGPGYLGTEANEFPYGTKLRTIACINEGATCEVSGITVIM